MSTTPFKLKGFPAHAGVSPMKHEPWAKAHREKVAHDGTAEAHGAKPEPPKKEKPADSPMKSNGRSKTKGPVVTDTRVSTSDGKSRKIGPEQSPKAIEKERQDYITQKKKTGEFSKETSKEYKEFAEADAYRKR